MEISLKPINYTGSNTDVCTLSRLLLGGVRVLALNSPHRKKHHLEQEMIQGQATEEKRVGGKEAGGGLLKEEMSVIFLPAAFSFCWKAGLSLFLLMLGGVGKCVCRIFNLLHLPHRRWESAHEARQLPKPYGTLRRGWEKSMWGLNLNRRLSSGISIVTQQHAYHKSLSNVPEGIFSQDYTIKASQYHSAVLILKKKKLWK